MFNKRSLGQQKRRAKEKGFKFLFLSIWKLSNFILKILFLPFVLIYYSFFKKNVSKKWKIFYRVCAILVWALYIYPWLIPTPTSEETEKHKVEFFSKNNEKRWASSELNIRSSPEIKNESQKSNVVSILSNKEMIFTLGEKKNGFEKIYNEKGEEIGWVSAKFLVDNLEKITSKKVEEEKNEEPLDFSVLKLTKVGLSSQNRATQKMILNVSEIPKEESIKETAILHWKKNSYSRYNEFTVFVYLPDMNTNESAYGIFEFDQKGNITYSLIKESSLYDTKWEKN